MSNTQTYGLIAEMAKHDGIDKTARRLGIEPGAVEFAAAYARIAGIERREVGEVEYAQVWCECGTQFVRMDIRYPDGTTTFVVRPLSCLR